MGRTVTLAILGALALWSLPMSAAQAAPPDRLHAGESLTPGGNDFLASPDGRFRLVMQKDCNLVLYSGQDRVWDTQTMRNDGSCRATMQGDGNFVVYDSTGVARWKTDPHPRMADGYLRLQNDRNLVMYTAQGLVMWDTQTFLLVNCKQVQANVDSCRIDQPNVTQARSPYPGLPIYTGDRITVNAGGCVQTGGRGLTWKRYVDPSGPNSDRYYFGSIEVPGATNGLQRLSQVLNRPLIIPAAQNHHQVTIALGYADDDYGDNGYNDHDNGTENQCNGRGNAYVDLLVEHGIATYSPPVAGNSGGAASNPGGMSGSGAQGLKPPSGNSPASVAFACPAGWNNKEQRFEVTISNVGGQTSQAFQVKAWPDSNQSQLQAVTLDPIPAKGVSRATFALKTVSQGQHNVVFAIESPYNGQKTLYFSVAADGSIHILTGSC